MQRFQKLISIMKEARTLLALEENDFSWSAWSDQNQAITEIDSVITKLEAGILPNIDLLFAPTGPIQEVSLSSGWGDEFIKLANQFDREYEFVKKP